MTDTLALSEEEWLARPVRAYVGCSVLITDTAGGVLLQPGAARRLTAALEARRTGAAALLHSAGYVG
ncbi:hypothetical protein [Kitasatospora sp. NPDC085464]|uniref:hypothetical protein n=1 Tax=Kitasatospora sp. NPDC085464 TaxID=3364063 RepID=UPI0037C6E1E6